LWGFVNITVLGFRVLSCDINGIIQERDFINFFCILSEMFNQKYGIWNEFEALCWKYNYLLTQPSWTLSNEEYVAIRVQRLNICEGQGGLEGLEDLELSIGELNFLDGVLGDDKNPVISC